MKSVLVTVVVFGFLTLRVAEINAEPPKTPFQADDLFQTETPKQRPVLLEGEKSLDFLKGQTLFDLDRLEPRSKSCGVNVVSEADLDALTSEGEIKAVRWFVALGAMSEEHAALREQIGIIREHRGGMVNGIADSLNSVDGNDSLLAGGGVSEIVGVMLLCSAADPRNDLAERRSSGAVGKTLSYIGPIGLIAIPGLGTSLAARLRYYGNSSELSLREQSTILGQIDRSELQRVAETLGKILGWDTSEQDVFARAVRAKVSNSLQCRLAHGGWITGCSGHPNGVEHKIVTGLKPLGFKDFLEVAKEAGLASDSEVRWVGYLVDLQEKLKSVTPEHTPSSVQSTFSRVEGRMLTKQMAFEQNVVTLNAYERLLRKLRTELEEKGQYHGALAREIDTLYGEVTNSTKTVKIMCDLGHLKSLHLFSGESKE